MKLKITITMDNAAFEPDNGTEAARLLRALADDIDGAELRANSAKYGTGYTAGLRDLNGNQALKAVVTR